VPILADNDMTTRGPSGEASVPAATVVLTPDEIAKVQQGHYTAALIWDAQTPWFDAVSRGAKEVFDQLGIKIVAQTQYNFDLNVEKQQVETVLALKPDILLTIADDPVISGQALQAAVGAGTKIVLLSTMPKGWTAGKQYVGMVTGDQAAMGAGDADALAQAIGGSGEVGILYHDASYFVTNRRDQVLVSTLVKKYPNIQIVAEQGFTTPDQAESLTSAMLVQHPQIKGIYAAWDAVTESAMTAISAANRTDLKVVTMDLGTGTAKDLVCGKQIVAIAIEQTYEMGTTMAREGALAMIGSPVPPFAVAPAIIVTKDTLAQSWRAAFHEDPPTGVTSGC
jgi:ribose transport system substrate-binding protein